MRSTQTIRQTPALAARLVPQSERDESTGVGSPRLLVWCCVQGHHFERSVRNMAKKPDGCPFCDNRQVLAGFNDLTTTYPDIAAEWHPTLNGDIAPDQVMPGTPAKAWWIAACGHSWDAEVRSRVRGYGCPYCGGVKVDASASVAATYPPIAHWWHPTRNGDLTPHAVAPGSTQKIAFRCPHGHDFTVPLNLFLKRRIKCRDCTGEVVTPGIDDLATTHPEWAQEWDPDNAVGAHEVSPLSEQPHQFRCAHGHRYAAAPRDLTRRGLAGCPHCLGWRPEVGVNDLATTHPALVDEWADPSTSPTEHQASSSAVIEWKCPEGHAWGARIRDRALHNNGCPFCGGRRPVPGVNDLATTHPEWARQWHPQNRVTPQEVTSTSGRRIRWLDQACGHEWTQQPRRRPSADCFVCTGNTITPGVDDVVTLHPHITDYLAADLNRTIDLTTLSPGSGTYLMWRCPEGHTWRRSIRRFLTLPPPGASPCPYCNGSLAIPGQTDLPTLHPEIAAQLNAAAHPADHLLGISPGSGLRVSWTCSKGHIWTARVVDRVHHKTGCPDCANEAWRSTGEDEIASYLETLGHHVRRTMRVDGSQSRHSYDIYLPEIATLIEFNGLYWHSDAFESRGPDYHAIKHKVAVEAGYRLITVWEDDWKHRRPIVEAMLANKTQRDTRPRVHARTTTVSAITRHAAVTFLDAHHIQGSTLGSVRLGLTAPNGELVAVLIARIQGKEATIARYATSQSVPGGFSKLLAALTQHLKEHQPQVSRLKTFSDNTISDGNLYRSLGFTHDGDIPPDYTYVRHGRRRHKFGYRRARFRGDPSLTYMEGLNETELADLNQLRRVWDCGKKRWVRDI